MLNHLLASLLRNSTTKFFFSIITLVLITPSQAAEVGSIPGEFSVSPSGAANYTIPIEVPPGINGLQPSLALVYDSQSGNGLLGQGWGLSGLSSITRCGKNLEQDGEIHGVDFSENDLLCFDGQRLVPTVPYTTGAEYWLATEYRTEIESFTKVTRSGAGFIVETKDGRKAEYGNTPDSAQNVTVISPAATPVLSWAVNKISDQFGNSISYIYDEDVENGEHKISSIDYAGDTISSVKFEYETRLDAQTGYFAGAMLNRLMRLKSVKKYSSPALVNSYTLSYEYSGAANISRLIMIDECDINNVCTSATDFGWSNKVAGSASNANYASPEGYFTIQEHDGGLRAVDIDGDGLTDLITSSWHTTDYGSGAFKRVYLNTGSGFVRATNYESFEGYFTIQEHDGGLRAVDIDGDGLTDLVTSSWHTTDYGNGAFKRVYLNTGSGFVRATNYENFEGYFTIQEHDGGLRAVDTDGDGLTDLVTSSWHTTDYGNGAFKRVYLNKGTALGFVRATNYENFEGYFTIQEHDGGLRVLDIDGDGLTDLVTSSWHTTDYGNGAFKRVYLNKGSALGFIRATNYENFEGYFTVQEHDGGLIPVEINGDGLTDLVTSSWHTTDYGYGAYKRVYLNTGSGFIRNTNYETFEGYSTTSERDGGLRAFDIDGDGLTDLVTSSWHTTDYGYGAYKRVYLNTGSGFIRNTNYEAFEGYSTIQGHDGGLRAIDIDGNGLTDLVTSSWHTTDYNNGAYKRAYINNGIIPNQKVLISDGMSAQTNINYDTLTNKSIYAKDTTATYPITDIQTPLHVVTTVSTDNAIGGQNTTTYEYGGLKVHKRGLGSLGFRWMKSTQVDTNSVAYTEYEQTYPLTSEKYGQDYPHTGSVKYASNTVNGVLLKEVFSNNDVVLSDEGLSIPYTPVAYTKNYDTNGLFLSKTRTTTVMNQFGNITSSNVFTAETDLDQTTGTGPDSEIYPYKTFTTSQFDNEFSVNWCEKGLASSSSVYKTNPQGQSPTVYQNFTYNSQCKILTESGYVVDLLGNRFDGITKTYAYNDFGTERGQISSTTITAPDIETRIATTQYDINGQFAEYITNEMGHKVYTTYDARFAVPLTKTDANGLTTSYTYNGFGELVETLAPGGNKLTTTKAWCDPAITNCTLPAIPGYPAQTVKFSITTSSTNALVKIVPDVTIYFDKLGREIRRQSLDFDGRTVLKDTAYNHLGRVVAVTQPYFEGDIPLVVTTKYDSFGRVSEITTPGEGVSKVAYDRFKTTTTRLISDPVTGLTTEVINHEEKNVIGQVLSNTDNDGNILTYEYNAQGNKIKTIMPKLDPTDITGQTVLAGEYNIIEIGYDVFGRKTSMTDPNMGKWFYEYDSTSKLKKQIDALGQVTLMEYDRLGRMTKRTDNDGVTTHWVYNDDKTNPAITPNVKAIGKLDSVYMLSAIGIEQYRQNISYADPYGLGLVNQTEVIIDGDSANSYITTTQYDEVYRPEIIGFPETSANKRFSLKYVYSNGVLNEVTSPDGLISYWQGLDRNAAGQIVTATLGENILNDQEYDVAGRVENIRYNVGINPASIYNVNYKYNDAGSLIYRDTQRNAGSILTEAYYYDTLDRLTSVEINGTANAKTFSYDVLGNMRSKNGVGSYEYADADTRPHAVSKAGTQSYLYNANGALTNGGGRTVTWTSFNKPASIYNSAASSSFKYGPSRARYQHSITDNADNTQNSTTIYIGGAYEKVTKNGVTTHKHYISAGGKTIAQHNVYSTGTEETKYLLRDNQGSVVAVVDTNGNVSAQLDYDAFGSRRTAYTGVSSIINDIPRGYTGHEHLDKLGLIHMNGRVYDPTIGRFLSADPIIQFSANLQSYNRYSYVLNNPMSYTDPSGFRSWRKRLRRLGRNIARAIVLGPNTALVAYSNPVKSAMLRSEKLRKAGGILTGIHPASAGAYSAYLTEISGGSNSDIFRAAGISAAAAYAGNQVMGRINIPSDPFTLNAVGLYTLRAVAMGSVSAAAAKLSGGNTSDAFWSGALGSFGPRGDNFSYSAYATGAIWNGLVAELTGGSFGEGAAGSLFGRMIGEMRAGKVKYDCGNGADCKFKNPGMKPALEKLAAQVHADGAGEVVVTGGDSYWDDASGKAFSSSTGEQVVGRGKSSFHNINRAADIRSQSLTIDQAQIPSYIGKASGGDFKVYIDRSGRSTNQYGVYHGDKHIHLTCNSQMCASN